MIKHLPTLFFLLLLSSFGYSQENILVENYFERSTDLPVFNTQKQTITASKFIPIQVDIEKLKVDLIKSKHRSKDNFGSDVSILILNPKGELEEFTVLANTTMHPDYQKKFEGIRTYDVIKKDNPSVFGKIDFTHAGFHAMIYSSEIGTYFIDPIFIGNDEDHIVYFKKDFTSDKVMSCEFEGDPNYSDKLSKSSTKSFGSCDLKTYRLALAATGEYTSYHGGDVSDAVSAQVTTMNRVNGVYERDMAVTMTIIANNDTIIFDDSSTDPFSNGNPGLMINQNQTTCTNYIGSANYDIGHVFGTNSGGLAGLGVVCWSPSKARGVTGSSGPVGDSFDIDYVAHEMGHQFGCNHTFNNSCNGNRNNGTAMEPGSGTTIMAYAGICSPNVQSNSDDHFHGISLEEMGDFLIDDGGNACAVITPLLNSAPEITATTGDVYIPISTPFALTAIVSDIDEDSTILYCWEQMDKEISSQPPLSTSVIGPNFRSKSPSLSPTRYFPNLSAVANGNSPTWEVLASVEREFNFRVVVRDNVAGGGCNDHADITINTVAEAGPFVVLYPSEDDIVWAGGSNQTVTWDVSNTDLSPIDCEFVDIYLSIDGGQSYPTLLAENVLNDGSQTVSVPEITSNDCRIMLMSDNGSFFDISDEDFEIAGIGFGFTLSTLSALESVCLPDDASYTIEIGSQGGFNEEVVLSFDGLPTGAIASFDQDTITPPASVTFTISGLSLVDIGDYNFTVNGSGSTGLVDLDLSYQVLNTALEAVDLIHPANAAENSVIPSNLNWEGAGVGSMYDIEVSTDASFLNIIANPTGITSTTYLLNELEANTTYYWRVSVYNQCVSTPVVSSEYSFTTVTCSDLMSADVPKIISASGTPTVNSTLEVSTVGTISGIKVVELTGTHSYVSDLTFTLTSPTGTTIELFSGICGSSADWDLNLDDNATPGDIPCPPTDGGTYQADGSLSTFIGEPSNGTWTLTISDAFSNDGGYLSTWGLELCIGSCQEADMPVLAASQEFICGGDAITLSIESGYLYDAENWNWYTEGCDGNLEEIGASVIVYPQESTTYYAKGVGGCTNQISCAEIDLDVFVTQTNVNVALCSGESYTFPDGTTSSESTINTSSYIAVNGCDSLIVTSLLVDDLDLTISQEFAVLTANQSADFATFQWVDCDNNNEEIEGETGQSFTPTENGNYAVILYPNSSVNCSETSDCETVIGVGIEEEELDNFLVYPNPSTGEFTIRFDSFNSYDLVEVMDYRGRIIYTQKMNGELELDFNLRDESNGIYILKLRNDKNVKVLKLIKQ